MIKMAQSLFLLRATLGSILTFGGGIFCIYWYIYWQRRYSGELLTGGPYSIVRHPLYSGFLVLTIGLSILYTTAETVFLVILSLVVIFYFIPREEEQLKEKYGNKYREYMKAVPYRLIPGIY